MSAQHTPTPRAGKTLTILANRGFVVSDFDIAANREYFGPAELFPHTDKELNRQIDFYRAIGGDEAIVDLRHQTAAIAKAGAA